MNLAYELPEYMPNAVSFAMDGSGNHYMFDMREEPINGEYPILFAHSGAWDMRSANGLRILCQRYAWRSGSCIEKDRNASRETQGPIGE